MPNAEIAVRLGVSITTVKTHVSRVLAKTGSGDREELRDWKGQPATDPSTSRRQLSESGDVSHQQSGRPLGVLLAATRLTGIAKTAMAVAGGVALLGTVWFTFGMLADTAPSGSALNDTSRVSPGHTPFYLEATLTEMGPPTHSGSTLPYRPGEVAALTELRWWWASPDEWRVEVELRTSLLDAQGLIAVANVDGSRTYSPISAVFTTSATAFLTEGTVGTPPTTYAGPRIPMSVSEFIRDVLQIPDNEVMLLGTEEVLGFQVEVVEYPRGDGSDVRAWLSTSSGFVLRSETTEAPGRSSQIWEVTELDLNPDFAPELFALVPDQEATEVPFVPAWCASAGGGQITGAGFRSQWPYLNIPGTPEGWRGERFVDFGGSDCERGRLWTLLVHDDERDGYILFDQRRRAAPTVPEWLQVGEAVDLADTIGYRTIIDEVEHLIWVQDGVIALLESNIASFEELLQMAESAEIFLGR